MTAHVEPEGDGDGPGVRDELGAAVPLDDVPRRLVSLVPSLSETLWWYGVGDRLVGITDFCVAPPHGFPAARRVRGTKNPDVGAIDGLAPDLVIANEEENRELDVRRLRDAGVPVYVTAPRTVAAAADTLARLGELVGAAAAGQGLAQSIRRAVEQTRTRRPESLTTFCPVWRDPWMATGADTYAADLLRCCGFEVLPDDPAGRYPRVSLDEVAGWRPDVVLLPDEPYAFDDADRSDFAGWSSRVRRIDGTQLTWYGPRTPHALADLTRLAVSIRRRRVRTAVPGRQ